MFNSEQCHSKYRSQPTVTLYSQKLCVVFCRVASRCVALRCVALRCVALRCVALRCVVFVGLGCVRGVSYFDFSTVGYY